MDKNFIIAIILMTLIIIIFSSPQYQKKFGKPVPVRQTRETSSTDSLKQAKPELPRLTSPSPEPEKQTPQESIESQASADTQKQQINPPETLQSFIIENEDIRLTFSNQGALITEVVLKKFDGKENDIPVQLVEKDQYWFDGLVQEDGNIIPFSEVLFSLESHSDTKITLKAEFSDDTSIIRKISIENEGYVLHAQTNLDGNWKNPRILYSFHGPINDTEIDYKQIRIWPFSMMMRDEKNVFNKIVYLGQGERTTINTNGKEKVKSIYSKEGAQKLEASKPGENEDSFTGDLDWYAVRNKYFIAAAIPDEKNRWEAYSRYSYDGKNKWFDYSLSKYVSQGNTDIDMYLGPISYDLLKNYGRDLTESMELSFRFIRPISILFLWLFKKLHTFIPNWGLVIIAFSIIIKIVLYPLSKTSFDSMRKMSALQPQIATLREKYKNNPQMLQKATMELYKKEGVNPFSGCLPMLLQMPVFFALYPVVGRAFELRQAMFIPYWIEDLSRPDPLYILPIAMGISMFFQSKTTMKDPNQKAMLYIMPVMMVILFANFSSGLTLYWFLFNVMSYAQQTIHR